MKQLTIDRELLPMKAHFFFAAAGMAPVIPFLPTIARQLGFSTVVVGIVYTILPFIALLAKPLSGIISDRFQIHKRLFIIVQVLGIFSLLGINYIRPLPQSVHFALSNQTIGHGLLHHCPASGELDNCTASEIMSGLRSSDDPMMECTLWCTSHSDEPNYPHPIVFVASMNVSQVYSNQTCMTFPFEEAHPHQAMEPGPNGTLLSDRPCSGRCNAFGLMYQLRETRAANLDVTRYTAFWQFLVCMIISWTAMTVVGNLADTICFQLLGDRAHLYGKQRLWAAVGWGIFSLIAGYLVDYMSRGQPLKDYSVVFAMMVVLLGCDVLASSTVPQVSTKRSGSMTRNIGLLLRSPQICVFLAVCIAVGMGTALIWNFLFWHLEELAESSAAGEQHCTALRDWMKTLQGLSMGVQCFGGELPFFFYSGALLKRIGHTHAMTLVLAVMSVRFLLYSLLANPWWVLPIELLQGVTYGVFYSTMASYASKVAPPGMASTVQGLVGAVHEGIGIAAGSLLGGVLMGRLGGAATFRWYGLVGLAMCTMHVVAQELMGRWGMGRLEGQVEASGEEEVVAGGGGGGANGGGQRAAEADVYRSVALGEIEMTKTGGE